jgi:hypothetical protein
MANSKGRPKVESKKQAISICVYFTNEDKDKLIESGMRYKEARHEATVYFKNKLNKILKNV